MLARPPSSETTSRPTSPPTTTSPTSAGPRSRTRVASTARPWPRSSGAPSTLTPSPSATPAGSSDERRRQGQHRDPGRQLGHELEGVVDPRELSQAHQAARGEGPAFEGAEASFELLIRRQRPDYAPPFRIVDYTCLVEQRSGRELLAEATVKVEVAGEVLHTAADGNGPVNALDGALRKALRAFYPVLDTVHLVDYKVRILDGAPRRPPGRASSSTRRTAPARGPPWAATRTSSRPRHRPRRLARVRDLEVRRRAPAARRAPLHDVQRAARRGRPGGQA